MKENIPEAVNETDYSLQYAAYDVRYFVNSENVVKCINIGNVDVYVEEINEIVKTGAMKMSIAIISESRIIRLYGI